MIWPSTPLLIHVHLPRSAGTTLNSLLEQWFEDRFLRWYDPDPSRIYSIEEIEEKLLSMPGIGCIASRSIRTYPRSICGRPARYITFLRAPIDRIISNCTYTLKNYGDFSPEHKRTFPQQSGELNLIEMLADWLRRADSLERTRTLGRRSHLPFLCGHVHSCTSARTWPTQQRERTFRAWPLAHTARDAPYPEQLFLRWNYGRVRSPRGTSGT
jgi:hypothetical protein